MLHFCASIVYNIYIPKILVDIKNIVKVNMEYTNEVAEGKQWISSAEVTPTTGDDGVTRYNYSIRILQSDKPDVSLHIFSRVFDDYGDCIELMNDRIMLVFLQNEENGFDFDEEEAEMRFNASYSKHIAEETSAFFKDGLR